jgi:c(7)-type cytochrome triheme protein
MLRCGWKRGAACLAGAVLIWSGGATAEQLRMPPDLVYSKAEGSPGKVVFSHRFHTGVSDKCTACHVKLFRMLQPIRQVSHGDMEAGKSCGACHNGQMVFGPTDPASCTRCHGG